MKPFLKWAGGKRQLLPEIKKLIPKDFNTYYEPFVGAGAVFLDLQKDKCVINDSNSELINCYNVIKNNLEELVLELKTYKNEKDFFLEIRALDRSDNYKFLSDIKKAARIIYLNHTCFNGLYRVNSNGYFNVPFGAYKNPKILDETNLRQIHNYLVSNEIEITNLDFEEILNSPVKGDFVYLDPPYDPISKTSDFTSYGKDKFSKDDQKRLKKVLDDLTKKEVKWLLSNSSTDFIKNLYKDYDMLEINANRMINSDASKRNKVKELLIKNF